MVFPESELVDLRENGVNVHILDKEFGVDCLLNLKSGTWLSVQEKYRDNFALKYNDFTQEYMNGDGRYGEWFKLGAQLYFYGWANQDNSGFEKWFLMDIVKYKMIIDKMGGIEKVGKLRKNDRCGSATFYTIPIRLIRDSFITDYRKWK